MQERSAGGKDRFSLFIEFTFTFKPFIFKLVKNALFFKKNFFIHNSDSITIFP